MKNLLIAFSALALLGACETLETGEEAASGQPIDAAEQAASDPNQTFLLSEVTCWESSTIPAEDSAHLLTMLYGYAAGVKGQTTHGPADVEATIGMTAETCAENPDLAIYDAMVDHWRSSTGGGP